MPAERRATYRVQLDAGFVFEAAASLADDLRELGVSHLCGLPCLEAAGLGQLLEIVPNHMALRRQDTWRWDVLENGPSSPFASYFDVEREAPEARLHNLVLLPVLDDHYGRALENRN